MRDFCFFFLIIWISCWMICTDARDTLHCCSTWLDTCSPRNRRWLASSTALEESKFASSETTGTGPLFFIVGFYDDDGNCCVCIVDDGGTHAYYIHIQYNKSTYSEEIEFSGTYSGFLKADATQLGPTPNIVELIGTYSKRSQEFH